MQTIKLKRLSNGNTLFCHTAPSNTIAKTLHAASKQKIPTREILIANENLSNLNLYELDLSGSIFLYCDFSLTTFEECNLSDVFFYGCKISTTEIINCELRDTAFFAHELSESIVEACGNTHTHNRNNGSFFISGPYIPSAQEIFAAGMQLFIKTFKEYMSENDTDTKEG